MEIQDLKKKLKMPHDAHVHIAELETILQEKEILENELQNTKATIGTLKAQNEELELQIQSLKMQVEQLSLADPKFSLVSKLGKLSVKGLEFKKL